MGRAHMLGLEVMQVGEIMWIDVSVGLGSIMN